MAGFVLDRLEHKYQVGTRVWVSGYHYLGQGTVVEVKLRLFSENEYVVEFDLSGRREVLEHRLEVAK
jgi:hypothetical protein